MTQPKLTLSYSDSDKNALKKLAQQMLDAGYAVEDKKRGGVSLSEVIRILVREKLESMK
jgi:hypothetical protein